LRKNKWWIDVLLVVLIIAMGYLIVRQFVPRNDNPNTESKQASTFAPTGETADDPPESKNQVSGELKAPDFTLPSSEGLEVALSDFRGKGIIVNFWATWCPPCKAEMPLFDAAAVQYKEFLTILAVNSGEEGEAIESFADQFSEELIFLLDKDYSVGNLYRVRGLPTSFFIDPDGVVQAVHVGELSEELLMNYMKGIGITK
jgi:thiol-disulfide isomerase/thioredoxin